MNIAHATLEAGACRLPGAAREPQDVLAILPYTDRALAERSARHAAARAGAQGLILLVEDADRIGFIGVANHVFRKTSSRHAAYLAQDSFAGREWLARGLAALAGGERVLLGFNDGKWHGALAGFGLVERAWAAGNYGGDLFWPGYRRHYADAELTLLAMSERRYAYDPDCVMVEVDWAKDHAAVEPADRALFRARAEAGFGGRVTDPRLQHLFS